MEHWMEQIVTTSSDFSMELQPLETTGPTMPCSVCSDSCTHCAPGLGVSSKASANLAEFPDLQRPPALVQRGELEKGSSRSSPRWAAAAGTPGRTRDWRPHLQRCQWTDIIGRPGCSVEGGALGGGRVCL